MPAGFNLMSGGRTSQTEVLRTESFRLAVKGAGLVEVGETDPQIGCYLLKRDAKELAAYARSCELSRPKLLILLVLRELQCRRLGELKSASLAGSNKKEGVRVTARPIHRRVKVEFTDHAASFGLGSDEAAAILFLADLKERWLEKALTGNRS